MFAFCICHWPFRILQILGVDTDWFSDLSSELQLILEFLISLHCISDEIPLLLLQLVETFCLQEGSICVTQWYSLAKHFFFVSCVLLLRISAVLSPSLLCFCSADIISLPCAVLLKAFTQANGLVFFSISCSEVAGLAEAIHFGARWHYCSHVICYYATWPEHIVFHEMYFLFFSSVCPRLWWTTCKHLYLSDCESNPCNLHCIDAAGYTWRLCERR